MTVSGRCHRLQEVKWALGTLNNFTILTSDDTTYDGDDESDSDSDIDAATTMTPTEMKIEAKTITVQMNTEDNTTDTDYNLSDDTILYIPETDLDETKLDDDLLLDTDSTRLNTDTDSTRLNTDTDSTRLNTDTDSTRLDADCILLNTDTDSTRLNSDASSDTTPLLIRPYRSPLPTTTAKRLRHNDRTSTDTDATPLLIRTNNKTNKQQPKRLFTATDD